MVLITSKLHFVSPEKNEINQYGKLTIVNTGDWVAMAPASLKRNETSRSPPKKQRARKRTRFPALFHFKTNPYAFVVVNRL